MRTGERLADAGELPVQAVLELAVSITRHSQVINRLLDYDLSSVARRVCFGTAESRRSRELRLLHRVSRNRFPRGSVATRLVTTCSPIRLRVTPGQSP